MVCNISSNINALLFRTCLEQKRIPIHLENEINTFALDIQSILMKQLHLVIRIKHIIRNFGVIIIERELKRLFVIPANIVIA